MEKAQFDKVIAKIKTNSEKLAADIHEAGMYALFQANQHNNADAAQRLINALGNKHATKRVKAWLVAFGKLGVKEGAMVFKKRKDISPETIDAMMEKANSCPWFDYSAEPAGNTEVDFLKLLKSALSKYENAVKEGKRTNHDELVDKVRAILPVEVSAAA